jgi:hypothetical protein
VLPVHRIIVEAAQLLARLHACLLQLLHVKEGSLLLVLLRVMQERGVSHVEDRVGLRGLSLTSRFSSCFPVRYPFFMLGSTSCKCQVRDVIMTVKVSLKLNQWSLKITHLGLQCGELLLERRDLQMRHRGYLKSG